MSDTYDDVYPISVRIYDDIWDAMRDHEARLVAKWKKRRDRFRILPRSVESREDGIALYMDRPQARLVVAFLRHAAGWHASHAVADGMDPANAKRVAAGLRRIAGMIADQGCGAKDNDIHRLDLLAKKANPEHIGCVTGFAILAAATVIAVILIQSLL